MDPRFSSHNLFRESETDFVQNDPQLRELRRLSLVYKSPLLEKIATTAPGIYTLTGGRQVGKTTFIKQFIHTLIKNRVAPEQILFISCELISDYRDLLAVVETELGSLESDKTKYIFIDEITYVAQWHRTLKHLADTGELENTFVMISGSDSTIIKDVVKQLPGRRGRSPIIDYQYYPLTFKRYVALRDKLPNVWIDDISTCSFVTLHDLLDQKKTEKLFEEFISYRKTGGYLTAVNELERDGVIDYSTFRTYFDWIRGDFLKRNKSETYLREIIHAIIRRYGSQITWNNLAADLSIDHPATVADYIQILGSMGVVIILPALREDTFTAAPKKAKKVYFSDPFIHYALVAWISGSMDPYNEVVLPAMKNPDVASHVVEAIAVNHFHRITPTFYIKGKGEIDVATIIDKNIQPVEIKWRSQIRKSDLKEMKRFPQGIIASKSKYVTTIANRRNLPLPVLLLRVHEMCKVEAD